MARSQAEAEPEPPASGYENRPVADLMRRERPKVVVKADLLPVVSVLSAVGLLGIPLGWLWAQLAPPVRSVVAPDGSLVVPGELESWQRFDALVIFMLLGIGAGIVIAVLAWMLRERRGPVMMAGAVAGSLLAAWLAMLIGHAVVGSMYEITDTPEVGDAITQAPRLERVWVLVAQPFATALTYGLLAAWNGTEDLGRRLG